MLCEFIPEAGASLSERGAGAGLIQPGSGSAAPVEVRGFTDCPDGPRASQGAHRALCHSAMPSCASQSHLPTLTQPSQQLGAAQAVSPPSIPPARPQPPAAPQRAGRAQCLCPLPAALAQAPLACARTDRGWSPELQSGSPARAHSTAVM